MFWIITTTLLTFIASLSIIYNKKLIDELTNKEKRVTSLLKVINNLIDDLIKERRNKYIK